MQLGFRVNLDAVSVCAGEGEGRNMKKGCSKEKSFVKSQRKQKMHRRYREKDRLGKRNGTTSATQQPGGGSVTQFPLYCHLNTTRKIELEKEKVYFSLYFTSLSLRAARAGTWSQATKQKP